MLPSGCFPELGPLTSEDVTFLADIRSLPQRVEPAYEEQAFPVAIGGWGREGWGVSLKNGGGEGLKKGGGALALFRTFRGAQLEMVTPRSHQVGFR